MDTDTLQTILGRFDRLDNKIDAQASQFSNMASRVTAVETKLDPIVNDAAFKRRAAWIGHAVSVAVSTGIIMAINTIWPHYAPPPSILPK